MTERERRQAVALAGAEGAEAARVIAKGYGDLAEQVIAEARRHGIYVHDSPELVGLLMGLDLDQRVPDRLYDVVAELLAWVAEMDARSAPSSAMAPRSPE
jgi:flagellar biosynthesis protein